MLVKLPRSNLLGIFIRSFPKQQFHQTSRGELFEDPWISKQLGMPHEVLTKHIEQKRPIQRN